MTTGRDRTPINPWFGEKIPPGESRDVTLVIGESYSGMTVEVPIHIRRAKKEGPVVFVTAALHGDEINGTGAIRQLIQDTKFQLTHGSVLLVPVLNLLAFERHSRYLPDRRDLNRVFPGASKGSLASRMAYIMFNEIVSRCDYGIDLHTAAIRRTNYPNVRGDLTNPAVKQLAEAFGSKIILNGKGPAGSFRRAACLAGCPTIIVEGGEIWKVEPGIVETIRQGISNVLCHLGMMEGKVNSPQYQLKISKTTWIRADRGGFMQYHIRPGDIVEKGQALATNTTLLGHEQNVLYAPYNAIVIGISSLPTISPGEPLCNLGKLPARTKVSELQQIQSKERGFHQQLSDDLASNILVVKPSD